MNVIACSLPLNLRYSTVELDLGVVKGKDNAVDVNVPADAKDIDDVGSAGLQGSRNLLLMLFHRHTTMLGLSCRRSKRLRLLWLMQKRKFRTGENFAHPALVTSNSSLQLQEHTYKREAELPRPA